MMHIARKTESRRLSQVIRARLAPLVKMPAFWAVTVIGNGFILCGATGLYYFEKGTQSKPLTELDSLSWAIGLVTTVGYGNLTPVTTEGKILGILLMIGGTLFLWSYMGLLVGVLLAPDISLIEKELKGIKRESSLDEKKLDEVIARLIQMEEQLKNRSGSVSSLT